jgi:hypothetical protein
MIRRILWCAAVGCLAAAGQSPPPGRGAGRGYQVVGTAVTGASEVRPSTAETDSKLMFESSDARLAEGFTRMKRQSMAYAFDGDPVGPWYEAAEPGREAFCMRDTAHQAMGAHALGLARHNKNMLHRFAENISDARDWCSFWEIDRNNLPAPVDYDNDAEFWYNLPANFDVLDACYRMFVWTGDRTYVTDPVFLNYYEKTVKDYVERWGLGLDQIMKRPRLMNVRGMVDPGKKFQAARGIPGYDEGNHEYVVSADVPATQYAAYLAYAYIQEARRNPEAARVYGQKAAQLRAFLNSTWWNEKEQHFYGRLGKDHQLEERDRGALLNWDAVEDGPKLKSALADAGHSIEVLYRYGDPDAAYARLMDAAFGPTSRREYPEVPFSWIGALVNGTMGITLESESPLQSASSGFWVEAVFRTLPGLGTKVAWAELRNLPVRSNEITVRHEGLRKTTVTNQHGPALIWQASFPGSFDTLLVNGLPVKARTRKGPLDRVTSWARVTVGGGGTVTVEAPK